MAQNVVVAERLTEVVVGVDPNFKAGAAAMLAIHPGRYLQRSVHTLPLQVGGLKVNTEFGFAQQLVIALGKDPDNEELKAFAAGALSVVEPRPELPNRIVTKPKDAPNPFRWLFDAHEILAEALGVEK